MNREFKGKEYNSVARVQRELGVKLPKPYITFLEKYKYIPGGNGQDEIPGIGNPIGSPIVDVVAATSDAVAKNNGNYIVCPSKHIVISNDGIDDSYVLLNTTNGKVVHSIFGKQKPLYSTFNEYLKKETECDIEMSKGIKRRIIGLDFFRTPANENITVNIRKMGENVGLESNDVVRGTDVSLKNITAAQYRDLLAGNAYLEFWIEAIDHTKPTANNRLYGEKEFRDGMDRLLHRVIRNGGLQPGEHEHPPIEYDPKLSKEENMAKITGRLTRFDMKNISHYIADTKTEGGKTYFLIRTNPSNPVIVRDISLGKVPTFSIRTLGDFPLINGVNVGQNLIVIGTDYVYNPANSGSRAVASNMKFVDPINATEVKIDLVAKVGNESVDIFKLGEGERLVVGIESDNSITMNIISDVKEFSYGDITRDAFSSIF